MVRDSTILFATAGILLAAVGVTGALVSDQMQTGDAYMLFLGAVIAGFFAYFGVALSLRAKGE